MKQEEILQQVKMDASRLKEASSPLKGLDMATRPDLLVKSAMDFQKSSMVKEKH